MSDFKIGDRVKVPGDWITTLSKRIVTIRINGEVETRAYRTPRAAKQAWRYWSAVAAQKERRHRQKERRHRQQVEHARRLLAESGGFLTQAVMDQAPEPFVVRVVLSGWVQAHEEWLAVSGFTERHPYGEVAQGRVALWDEVGPGSVRVLRPAEGRPGEVVEVLFMPQVPA